MSTKDVYIFQLSTAEKLAAYKRIKAMLIKDGCFNYENILAAMSSKIKDVL